MTATVQLTNDFKEIVTGRRSIKNYDQSVKISREEMEEILTLATLAPSSINMQPWRFLVIESPEAKATLAPLARFNQNQVETSSAVIAVFGDLKNFDNAEEIYGKAVELGYMPLDVKEGILASFAGYFENITNEQMKDVVLVDGGLVSMQLMLAARAYGYDTNAIGGYEKDKIAEAFGLEKERYVPVMLISIGKAADNGHQSVRLPINKVAQWK
ncbi:Putative NAD(P)H nitroreductase YodC [Peribacillus sp. Bi96]|uniref:nitroreductase family protein n=1 Tax=unclassified Peribacillus TaxID=2675266 RepID=UPI001DAB895C|nr:nitroreductase family protein [Peribacillus sp. Bi96]CAH0261041.1 Putative NAD(P)H nitroreductase YodC [Peribacillus sp. Bi96]